MNSFIVLLLMKFILSFLLIVLMLLKIAFIKVNLFNLLILSLMYFTK